MAAILILLTFALSPTDSTIHQTVNLVELNHVHDENGKHTFDQLIFYTWDAYECRHQVIAWRLAKSAIQLPTRDWRHGGYVTTIADGETTRVIRSPLYREIWTMYDVEMSERDVIPQEKRRGLD